MMDEIVLAHMICWNCKQKGKLQISIHCSSIWQNLRLHEFGEIKLEGCTLPGGRPTAATGSGHCKLF